MPWRHYDEMIWCSGSGHGNAHHVTCPTGDVTVVGSSGGGCRADLSRGIGNILPQTGQKASGPGVFGTAELHHQGSRGKRCDDTLSTRNK